MANIRIGPNSICMYREAHSTKNNFQLQTDATQLARRHPNERQSGPLSAVQTRSWMSFSGKQTPVCPELLQIHPLPRQIFLGTDPKTKPLYKLIGTGTQHRFDRCRSLTQHNKKTTNQRKHFLIKSSSTTRR